MGVVTWVAPQQGITFAIHAQHLLDLTGKLAEKPYRLPVPDSLQGPGVTDTAVLAQLEKFRRDYQEYLAKVVSVRDTEKRLEIARSETPTPAHAAESQAGRTGARRAAIPRGPGHDHSARP